MVDKQSFPLERGKPSGIGGNRPMKFKVYLESGGYIEGIIPANEKLVVCSEGDDIRDIDINIDDDCMKAIQAV